MIDVKVITAKIRNLFSLSDFQKRYSDDDRIQVKTHNGKVLEKNEAFPYGFYAKAKSGKALVFCQGGNFDNFEILPVLKDTPVLRQALEDGDVAIYTGEGSYIVLREKGGLEIYTRQKGDIKVICEGNIIAAVDGNCECDVKGDTAIKCGGNSAVTVGGNSITSIHGNCICDVNGIYTIKAGIFTVAAGNTRIG